MARQLGSRVDRIKGPWKTGCTARRTASVSYGATDDPKPKVKGRDCDLDEMNGNDGTEMDQQG